jgi:hypothetical protein
VDLVSSLFWLRLVLVVGIVGLGVAVIQGVNLALTGMARGEVSPSNAETPAVRPARR